VRILGSIVGAHAARPPLLAAVDRLSGAQSLGRILALRSWLAVGLDTGDGALNMERRPDERVSAMQAFTLYGIDENGQCLVTEIFRAESFGDGVQRLARERSRRFASVELWQGARRLMRVTRRPLLK
jgi:hypothetical protein